MAECIKCGSFTTYINGYCTSCYQSNKKPFIQKEFVPSEGEEYISDFLKLYGIKYEEQKRIEKLNGDYSDYRIADFYLPKYNVYIEFLGQWNNPEEKKRYTKKMEVYKSNNIPCIYLYPENLGFLDFVFDKRLQTVLFAHELHSELKKYRLYKLIKGEGARVLFISFFILMLFSLDYNKNEDTTWCLAISGLIIYQLFKITFAINRVFKGKYPMRRMLE